MRNYRVLSIITLALVATGCAKVDDPGLFPEYSAESATPPVKQERLAHTPERQLLWGDLHIHTSYSTDAFVMGVRSLPDDAYRFAKGGEIEHAAGYGIRIGRPLDFAAVTDHSEYLGVIRAQKPDLPLSTRSLRERLVNDSPLRTTFAWIKTMVGFNPRLGVVEGADKMSADAWQEIIDSAERNNDPGRFTSFIGYEWSSMPDKNNLHRNVIYRGHSVPAIPYSSLISQNPEDLWAALEAQRANGMDNLAIPHNGNVSNGLMYDRETFDGKPLTEAYAQRRLANEPVSEIFQVKGSSETHPVLSPNDAFAGFEIFDTILSGKIRTSEPEGSYARDALRLGIELAHTAGFNPYRFGVIGSSDSHNASSSVEEDNFHGKLPLFDGSAGIRLNKNVLLPEQYQLARRWGAAGLAAVWAEENTRESIFDALRRRETFATSGPRISVRFFGGWGYPRNLIDRDNRIELAEASGVPMGGRLPPKPFEEGGLDSMQAPMFAVWASKDPAGANLDRIQIIKAWVDGDGVTHEKVIDVVWSDQRKLDPATGKLPDVGNTVDVASASYSNSIGAVQLQAVWQDPQFDPDQHAVYYARVIEIPTPRWTTYDAMTLGVPAPEPVSLQERAITSAIWYEPVSPSGNAQRGSQR